MGSLATSGKPWGAWQWPRHVCYSLWPEQVARGDSWADTMCFHVWNIYQRHTTSMIRVENDSCSWSLLLTLPSCSPRLQPPSYPPIHPHLPRTASHTPAPHVHHLHVHVNILNLWQESFFLSLHIPWELSLPLYKTDAVFIKTSWTDTCIVSGGTRLLVRILS